MNRHGREFWVLTAGFLLIGFSIGSAERPQSTGKILFLTFAMNHDETITLKRAQVVPGTLKNKKRRSDGEILYEAVNADNGKIVRGALRLPLLRHLDYPDPKNPAVLKGGAIVDSTAEFVVRIPYEGTSAKISFFKKTQSAEEGFSKRPASGGFSKGKLLGSYTIHRPEGEQ